MKLRFIFQNENKEDLVFTMSSDEFLKNRELLEEIFSVDLREGEYKIRKEILKNKEVSNESA